MHVSFVCRLSVCVCLSANGPQCGSETNWILVSLCVRPTRAGMILAHACGAELRTEPGLNGSGILVAIRAENMCVCSFMSNTADSLAES